jgi:hypothetical protein
MRPEARPRALAVTGPRRPRRTWRPLLPALPQPLVRVFPAAQCRGGVFQAFCLSECLTLALRSQRRAMRGALVGVRMAGCLPRMPKAVWQEGRAY